jgi:hypothetical protein
MLKEMRERLGEVPRLVADAMRAGTDEQQEKDWHDEGYNPLRSAIRFSRAFQQGNIGTASLELYKALAPRPPAAPPLLARQQLAQRQQRVASWATRFAKPQPPPASVRQQFSQRQAKASQFAARFPFRKPPAPPPATRQQKPPNPPPAPPPATRQPQPKPPAPPTIAARQFAATAQAATQRFQQFPSISPGGTATRKTTPQTPGTSATPARRQDELITAIKSLESEIVKLREAIEEKTEEEGQSEKSQDAPQEGGMARQAARMTAKAPKADLLEVARTLGNVLKVAALAGA